MYIFYYCAHDIVLEAVEKLVFVLFGRSKIMALVDYIVAPILTLMILIGIVWLMKRYTKTI